MITACGTADTAPRRCRGRGSSARAGCSGSPIRRLRHLASCHTESMAALSALVFSLSWWLGLYLLARDPRKPVLVFSAIGLCSFAMVVALDAVRLVTHSALLGQVEIYLVAVPGVAWFAVLVELARPGDSERSRTGEVLLVGVVAALTLFGATMAGSVDGPLRLGHVVMCAVISVSTLGAMVVALRRRAQKIPVVGLIVTATMFFALANAILIIPLGVVPSWLALASTGCDVLAWAWRWRCGTRSTRARRCGPTCCARSPAAAGGRAVRRSDADRPRVDPPQSTAQIALTVLLFTSLAIAIVGAGAGRSAGRAAGPAGLLASADAARRPGDVAAHPVRAAAAVGRSARRLRRRHLRPADPPRAGPLRRPVQAGRQPADRAAGDR